ncbi:hypothetical protein QQ045_017054 [Rhodiola kirilowii]
MEEVDDQLHVDHHHHHHQNNNNNNHYAAAGLTDQTASCSYFPPPPQQPPDLAEYHPMIYSTLPHRFIFNSNTPNHQNQQQQPYPEVDGGAVVPTTASTYLAVGGGGGLLPESYCSARWPREETMILLQIRSRLHSNFKQATHKGPLWDEVSRIMYEEHGYQRSGKKCREKFENLYKYYKKTKEAKSSKHDGKHYRFFRQLEALYGDKNEVVGGAHQPITISHQTDQFPPGSNNDQVMMVMRTSPSHLLGYGGDQEVSPSMKLPCDHQSCLSLSNQYSSSQFTSSSSEDNNKRGGQDHKINKNKMKMKIKEFVDIQMKSLIEQQQLCMERVLEKVEQNEKERVLREEEWRKQAEERLEKEHKYWASEIACMKTRDAALMETLQQFFTAAAAAAGNSSSSRAAATASLATHMQQIPFSSPPPPSDHQLIMNKKPAECSSVVMRDPPLSLYNNHHHNHEINGFRFMMSDGSNNINNGVCWDGGSSFGLKLNNADDENHQN